MKVDIGRLKSVIREIEHKVQTAKEAWQKFKEWVDDNDYLTPYEAAAELKVWPKTVKEVLRTTAIHTKVRQYGDYFGCVLIRRRDLTRLLDEIEEHRRHRREWD